jgi:hypothetical protein
MDSNSSSENVTPHSLSSAEINKILSMTLIAMVSLYKSHGAFICWLGFHF